jgi:septal ring factor EnvC (AmiA/AmiB activator)
VISLLVLVLVVVLGVYETIPVKEHKATASDPTAQAIHDLQASVQQVVDQLRALQQTVSSDQTETKQLSDQVNALSSKLKALQRSFASAQQAPVAVPSIEPATPKRGAR